MMDQECVWSGIQVVFGMPCKLHDMLVITTWCNDMSCTIVPKNKTSTTSLEMEFIFSKPQKDIWLANKMSFQMPKMLPTLICLCLLVVCESL